MKLYIFVIIILSTIYIQGAEEMRFNELSPEEKNVIINKGTEQPFTGKYDKFFKKVLPAIF